MNLEGRTHSLTVLAIESPGRLCHRGIQWVTSLLGVWTEQQVASCRGNKLSRDRRSVHQRHLGQRKLRLIVDYRVTEVKILAKVKEETGRKGTPGRGTSCLQPDVRTKVSLTETREQQDPAWVPAASSRVINSFLV